MTTIELMNTLSDLGLEVNENNYKIKASNPCSEYKVELLSVGTKDKVDVNITSTELMLLDEPTREKIIDAVYDYAKTPVPKR